MAGDGGAIIWPQLVGYARAKEYLLTGDLMDAATAAQSIAKLDQSTAVRILIRMKDKQAADVLANMGPDKSVELIAKITNK